MVGEVFTAMVQGGAALAEIFCECLTLAAGTLADAADTDKRVSRKRLLIAFVPLAVFVGTIAGAVGYYLWRDAQRRQTRETVDRVVVEVAGSRDVRGHVTQPDAPLPSDAWNRPLQFKIHRMRAFESVTVWSFGPDGEDATRDDISATRQVIIPKEVAGIVIDNLGDALRRRFAEQQ